MPSARSVLFDIVGRDSASPAFLSASRSAEKAATSMSTSMARIDTISSRSLAIGQKISKAVTLPLVAVAAVSVKAATDFQKQVTLLQTAGGELDKNMTTITNGIKTIAVSTGTSLSQLTEGAYTIEKAGYRGADALKLLKAAAQGAKAEGVDLGVATNALTTIMQSYGAKASEAVQYENMLIKGAGQAKTTMTDFASSLSNVVPLAASLGIGFDQVAGAIDTMTQHGETAQQATDNLNNLFRNLAGANNVAASTMLQLGINTVSLSKTLQGPGGLTKALAIIHKALVTHTKDGLITVDTQKASVLATKSLNQMMGTFSGSLKTQSKELLSGKEGIAEYQKYAKSMGGVSGASALQFLALYKSSKGFSDQLRAGRGTTMTASAALQKMTGGATGLNVALMLGLGTTKASAASAKTFAESTKANAAAAKLAGQDVMGWAKTQETAAVKLGKLKSAGQVFAVDLGNHLLPALTKIVDAGIKAFNWFDKLSSGWKKSIGYSLLFVAALGPLLAIVGRVGKAITTLWRLMTMPTRFVAGVRGATTSMVGMESRAYTTGRRVGSSFLGIGRSATTTAATVAEAEAAQTRAIMGGTAKQIAAIDKMRAAQARAMVNAPVATGGVVAGGTSRRMFSGGGVGSLAVGTLAGFGGQMLGSAIDDGHKGSGRNVAASIARDAGTGALVGSFFGPEGIAAGAALGAGYGALKAWIGGVPKLSAGMKDLNAIGKNSTATVEGFSAAFLTGGAALKTNETAAANAALANTGLAKRAAAAGLTQKDLTNAITGSDAVYNKLVETWKASGKPSADTLAGFKKLHDEFKSGVTAAQAYADAHGLVIDTEVKTVSETDLLSGKIVNFNKLHLTAAMSAKVFNGELTSLTQSVATNGKTLDGATSFGQKNISVIQLLAKGALAHAQAVYTQTGSLKLADIALANDKQHIIDTARQAGLSAPDVKKLVDQIDGIKDKHAKITLDVASAKRQVVDLSSFIAQQLTSAFSTTPSTPYGIYKPGQGPNSGITNNGPSLPGIHNAKGTSGLGDGWFTVGEQGYELGHKSGSKVEIFSNAQSKAMTGMSRVPGYASGTSSAIKDVVSQIAAFLATDHNRLSASADLKDAAKSLRDAAKSAKVSASALKSFDNNTKKLAALGAKRDSVMDRLGSAPSKPTAYDNLATAQGNYADARSGVLSAFTGGFDITTAGVSQTYSDQAGGSTAGSIVTAIQAAAAKATKFAALLKKLGAEGLNKTLLQQLANAGPSAYDQALAISSATPKQILAINTGYGQINTAGSVAGKFVADDMYGAGLTSAQGIVNGLLSQEGVLNAAIKKLGDSMVKQLKKTMGIHSPSRVTHGLGRQIGQGYIDGIRASIPAVNKAAKDLGNAGTPEQQMAGWKQAVKDGRAEFHQHIYPSPGMDEVAIGASAARRINMLGKI